MRVVTFLIGLGSIGGAVALAFASDATWMHLLCVGPGIAGGMVIGMAFDG